MKTSLDTLAIDIACPSCGKKISEQVGRLKNKTSFICPGCKAPIRIDAHELRIITDRFQKSSNRLRRSLGKLGK